MLEYIVLGKRRKKKIHREIKSSANRDFARDIYPVFIL